jgi:hypothetical protein
MSKNLCRHQLNQPFVEKMMCGRIFSSAAEFFSRSGRKPLPEVGNTEYTASLSQKEKDILKDETASGDRFSSRQQRSVIMKLFHFISAKRLAADVFTVQLYQSMQ